MIKVYQIQLTNAEIATINRGESTPRTKAYFDRSFDSMFKTENFQYYDHAATVHGTDDMEAAFRAMNLWEDDHEYPANGIEVEKMGPCSSMSVGDILEVNGNLFRCASFGFDAI